MRKGENAVVIINRLTMEQVDRFDTVSMAAKSLGVKAMSIYRSLCGRIPVYDCYWVYEKNLPYWIPKHTCFKRLKGIKVPEKLQVLLDS